MYKFVLEELPGEMNVHVHSFLYKKLSSDPVLKVSQLFEILRT